MTWLLIFGLLITLTVPVRADSELSCVPVNFAFQPGEVVEYTVYYNWGPIWVSAGLVTFKVHEILYRNRPAYHFDSYGTTLRRYDWFFKVRDRFESYVDKESFRPLWYEMDTYEGGFVARDVYNFFPEQNLVITVTEDTDRPLKIDTLVIEQCSFDVLTAVYVARNIDFELYDLNETIPFNLIIRDELMELAPRFLGNETITTRDGVTYDCIKFSVELVEGFIFKPGDEMFVWVTNDDNRVPVLVEAQVRVGSVKAMLNSTSGLKNPESARLEN